MSAHHKIKILVSDPISEEGINIFKNAGFEVTVKAKLSPDELKAELAHYDGLVIRSGTKVTAHVLEGATRLKVIGRAGAGLDNVDLPAATNRGIVVMNTPGGNTITTAEHTVSMMMSMARRIPQANASNKSGKWEKSKFMGIELAHKTLGILGMGKIGSHVAHVAQGLLMNVIAYDPFLTAESAARQGVTPVTVEELFSKADIITVHTPLTPETTNLISSASIAKMKKGVYIVNCARGGIVNEADLAKALESGHVAGAAFDVFSEEPPSPDSPLLKLDNFISTPHIGAATKEAQENVALAVADQMVDYLAKGIIRYAANLPSVPPEDAARVTPYQHLAEVMGGILSQIATEAFSKISVEFSGEAATLPTQIITIAALKGVLAPMLDVRVNEVNAPLLAKDRGLEVVESRSSQQGDYVGLITLRATTSKGSHQVSGSIFQKKDFRIVSLDTLPVEVVPDPIMLYLTNQDQPGVVGLVGSLLGSHGVNISRMQFGRDFPGGKAVSMIGVDSEPPAAVLEEIRKNPKIIALKLLRLPSLGR